MAYTLKQFCADHHALLTSGQPLAQTLPQIADKLSLLLRNPEFVAESFKDDPPPVKRTLHHDPDTDVYVLAHVNEGPRKGSPHSHGAERTYEVLRSVLASRGPLTELDTLVTLSAATGRSRAIRSGCDWSGDAPD